MQTFNIKIKGITPYMQHRMDDQKLEQWEKKRGPIHERPEVNYEDAVRAEYHCYRNDSDQCFIPADQIRGALIGAGTYVKSKVGGRSKSMKIIVAAMFMVSPDQILLPEYDSIDKRSAVNRNVKARIIVIRPKWTSWEAEFQLNIYESSITIEMVRQLIEHAGNLVGIGSFRPTNSGLFGRFEIVDITRVIGEIHHNP